MGVGSIVAATIIEPVKQKTVSGASRYLSGEISSLSYYNIVAAATKASVIDLAESNIINFCLSNLNKQIKRYMRCLE